jgi:torsin-1
MIADAVFKKGTSSKYFHLFHGSQYENSDDILAEQKKSVRNEIENAIYDCPYSVFVFDEVDKMPPGIFDSITPYLDYHSSSEEKDFTKATFIFLTNYGGEEISKILYGLTNNKGLYRHETKLHHFEEVMKIGVYNRVGGLQETPLIKSAVIDFYIPFLPLEEKHIIECIKAEFSYCHIYEPRKELIDEILKYIGFNSNTNYAHSGCKTIYAKVQAECFS